MHTIKNTLTVDLSTYPYEHIAPFSDMLFIDIETTGLAAHSSSLYLIGCAYYKEGRFHTIQWFADNYQEEELLLYHFFNFAQSYRHLIHYNGNHFDIPYLEAKCLQYDLPFNFKNMEGTDLYKRILPYRSILKLGNMKQKTVEDFLGIERDDTYDGGQLINIYHDYVSEPKEFSLQLMLLHNYEDLRGMIRLVPALAYTDIFNLPIKVEKAGRNKYTGPEGEEHSEILMEIRLPNAIPAPISYGWTDCYLTAHNKTAKLKVALKEGELKFFYPNYKEYYYLPAEDTAIHKSVAAYVDKGHREPAKASNCYGKKSGVFLPEWEPLFAPTFRENYHDKTMYFELTDDFKRDPKKFTKYAEHVLQIMAHPVI